MDPSLALSELKLELPTTADAIKRAYLRGVKAHPPERDPEGFQRVREAYDFLRGRPWYWEAQPASDAKDAGFVVATSVAAPLVAASGEAVLSNESAMDFLRRRPPPPRMKRPAPEVDAAWLLGQARNPASEVQARTLLSMTLDCTLRLFQRRKGDLGVALLRTVEDRIAWDGARSRELSWLFGKRVLVHELVKLHRRVDPKALRLLARGIRRNTYVAASKEFSSQLEVHGATLRATLEHYAPTLLGAMKFPPPPSTPRSALDDTIPSGAYLIVAVGLTVWVFVQLLLAGMTR